MPTTASNPDFFSAMGWGWGGGKPRHSTLGRAKEENMCDFVLPSVLFTRRRLVLGDVGQIFVKIGKVCTLLSVLSN